MRGLWVTDHPPTKKDGNMHGEVIVCITGFDRDFACQWDSSYLSGTSFVAWMPFPPLYCRDAEQTEE